MQSIQCINYGSTASEAVKSNLIRKPTKNELKPLEILVEVLACGCDFVQLLLMQNKYQLKQKPPFTLGGEACGRIIALDEGGSGGLKFSSGRHVYTLVGDVHYDQIATMQYPSRNAFVAFANSQGSQQKGQLSEEAKKAGKLRKDLRTAGLAVQALIAIQPDKADAIRDPNAPNYSRI